MGHWDHFTDYIVISSLQSRFQDVFTVAKIGLDCKRGAGLAILENETTLLPRGITDYAKDKECFEGFVYEDELVMERWRNRKITSLRVVIQPQVKSKQVSENAFLRWCFIIGQEFEPTVNESVSPIHPPDP
ncbi:uncharacterized [Tachysurus ichikawai]